MSTTYRAGVLEAEVILPLRPRQSGDRTYLVYIITYAHSYSIPKSEICSSKIFLNKLLSGVITPYIGQTERDESIYRLLS